MFAKLLLSMVIITSGGIIGYIMAFRYVQRLQQLKNLYISFQLLETEIQYSSNSLPGALYRVGMKSNKFIGDFFLDTQRILDSRTGCSIEEAWAKAIESNISSTSLDQEDQDVLLDFGNNLGCTDREHQLKNFQYIYLQLKKRQEHAEIQRQKNENMFKNLGVLIGIAIVIVFI